MLPLAKFAYNNSVHHRTRMTPFWASYHYHPPMQFKPPRPLSKIRSEILAEAKVSGLDETHQLLRESLLEAKVPQWNYSGGKNMTFLGGNQVWLSTRLFQTTRPSKKLDYKCTGLYTMSKIINKNAYKPDLPKPMRNHNVINESQLDHYTPLVVGQPSLESHPVIGDDSEECKVELILDTTQPYQMLHYLIQWAGYYHIRIRWELINNLENSCELIDEFHQDHPNNPRKWRKSDLRGGGIDPMQIWRFRSRDYFLLSICFVGTWSSTNGVGMGFTTSRYPVNWR